MLESLLSTFQGGDNRMNLSLLEYIAACTLPSTILALVIITPNDTLSNKVKQLLSIPLLLAVFFAPFRFTQENRVLDLVGGVTCYNLFLRYIELYWVGPTLAQDNNRPVYTTAKSLWIDFWTCLRTFDDSKVFKKDKKIHHILFYLAGQIIMTDILATFLCSYSGREVVTMASEAPLHYFIYFAAIAVLLNAAFNAVGYSLQLFYVVCFEEGSWSSEQWRPLMIHPAFSTSLEDLWSHRWHQLFKSTWLAFPFRPVRVLTLRGLANINKNNAKSIAFLLASVSVFVASAGMHEYVIAANMGWPIYYRFFMGEQCIFFIGHGIGVMMEHVFRMVVRSRMLPKNFDKENSVICRLLQHAWVVVFGYVTFLYIANGFLMWGFQFDNKLQTSKPIILEFAKENPRLMALFGSNI